MNTMNKCNYLDEVGVELGVGSSLPAECSAAVAAFGAVGTANLSKTADDDPAEELRVPVLLDPTACGAGGAMGGGTMMALGPGPAL